MRYISIPKTDLKVSGFCMGSAEFGHVFDEQVSYDTLDRFVAFGGNFIDTSVLYANWIPNIERSSSENTIGRWLKSRNAYDKMVIATKGGVLHVNGSDVPALGRDVIESQIEESRSHLGLDTLTLYYLHRDDKAIPVEDIMDVLFKAQDKGKIKYLGCSNWTAARIKAANAYAEKCGRQGFIIVSDRWSLAKPNDGVGDKNLVNMNDELYQLHIDQNLTAVPFSSTGQAFLTRIVNGEKIENHPVYGTPENLAIAERAKELAAQKNVTVAQLALSYFYSHPFTAIPITAFREPEQMQEAVEATEIILTDEEFKFLTGK